MEHHKFNFIELENYEFATLPPIEYHLNDVMCSYYDGISYKIIALTQIINFPVICDKYMISDEKMIEITIAICPFTLAGVVLEGKYKATEFVDRSCLVISNGTEIFPIISPPKKLKKMKVEIKTLKNIFNQYTDSKYLITNSEHKSGMSISYYGDVSYLFHLNIEVSPNLHPKTLI